MGRKDSIQRDFDRLEMWTCAKLMNFDKAKYKLLHLGGGNPKNRLSGEWIKTTPGEKNLGMFVNRKLSITHQCVLADQKANYVLGFIRCEQQLGYCPFQFVIEINPLKGFFCFDPYPLLSPGEATSGVLCPVLGSLGQERHGAPGDSPAESNKDD
ncbi:rna-directed dna polymerase from mobile element jockey-like [Pitangus sulphuratus]|nr:rna-directed dna polymerase from mobile element jockey-like [Pitangus sulphuratus]